MDINKKPIKIVFIGDSQVGKTSMIRNSLAFDISIDKSVLTTESLINPVLV